MAPNMQSIFTHMHAVWRLRAKTARTAWEACRTHSINVHMNRFAYICGHTHDIHKHLHLYLLYARHCIMYMVLCTLYNDTVHLKDITSYRIIAFLADPDKNCKTICFYCRVSSENAEQVPGGSWLNLGQAGFAITVYSLGYHNVGCPPPPNR